MVTAVINGRIVDGRKTPAFYGSIRMENGRITGVFPAGHEAEATAGAKQVLDAEGNVVCPGFVDTHSHMDVQFLKKSLQESLIRQGITTSLLGQDGVSMAPLPAGWRESWGVSVAGMDGSLDGLTVDYETVDGYLGKLEESSIGSNAAYLVPHGNIRLQVMGMEDRAPDQKELEQMKALLREALKQGAAGLSAGLLYVPCAYAGTEELIELCRVVAEYDSVFVVHQRSEADDILSSMDEIIRIGRESGVHIHFSHFKACGKNTWPLIPQMLQKLDAAEKEGIRVSFDQYPYAAGSTTLLVVLPPWVQEGGPEKLFARLKDPDVLARIRREIEAGSKGWDNFVDFAGWDGIFLTYAASEENRKYVGASIQDIAQRMGTDPLSAAVRLILEEKGQVSMVDFYGKEEHVERFLLREEQNVCTDGVISGTPHPRCYGTYPRILEKYVREKPLLTLEEAVYKMTYKAAEVFGMEQEIGSIETGKAADLVIFSPERIAEKGTFAEPAQYPDGIEGVFINGKPVLWHGRLLEEHAGRVLRRRYCRETEEQENGSSICGA